MKFNLIIDPEREEEVVIYAHKNHPVFTEIEQLLQGVPGPLIGYAEDSMILLSPEQVSCFVSEGDKVFALVGKERYWVKLRLYRLAELLGSSFIRINQSCLANMGQIERFSASFGGSLAVIFKNGHRDYVSRREWKKVKERFGIL